MKIKWKVVLSVVTIFCVVVGTYALLTTSNSNNGPEEVEITIRQYVDCKSIIDDEYRISTGVWVVQGEKKVLEKAFFNEYVKCENIEYIKNEQMKDAEEAKLKIEEALKTIEMCDGYWGE